MPGMRARSPRRRRSGVVAWRIFEERLSTSRRRKDHQVGGDGIQSVISVGGASSSLADRLGRCVSREEKAVRDLATNQGSMLNGCRGMRRAARHRRRHSRRRSSPPLLTAPGRVAACANPIASVRRYVPCDVFQEASCREHRSCRPRPEQLLRPHILRPPEVGGSVFRGTEIVRGCQRRLPLRTSKLPRNARKCGTKTQGLDDGKASGN
jgi:hypothetical protein